MLASEARAFTWQIRFRGGGRRPPPLPRQPQHSWSGLLGKTTCGRGGCVFVSLETGLGASATSPVRLDVTLKGCSRGRLCGAVPGFRPRRVLGQAASSSPLPQALSPPHRD